MHRVGPMSAIDRKLFESLVREHHAAVYRAARRILRCDADAEDVTQHVFLHVLRNSDRIGEASDTQRTLRWLATRLALNEIRRVRRRESNERSAPMQQPSTSPPELAFERERIAALTAAVADLHDDLRIPMVLRYQEGLSYAMVGRALGVAESTVYERVRRGLDRLRGALARLGVLVPVTRLEQLCTSAGAVDVPSHLQDGLLALQAPAGAAAAPCKLLATGAVSLVMLTGAMLDPPLREPAPPVVASAAVAFPLAVATRGSAGLERPRRVPLGAAMLGASDANGVRDGDREPQSPDVIRVPLRVVPISATSILVARQPRGAGGQLSGPMVAGSDYELDFAGVPTIRLTGLDPSEDSFVLRVDRDDDGDFGEEEARVVSFRGKVEIAFTKRRGDGVKGDVNGWLWPSRNRQGDSFAVQVQYAATGKLTVDGRSAGVRVLDVDGNGYFERSEFRHGTTLQIDLDGDGDFSSPGEFVSGQHMFELDERALSWGRLARDGSWIEIAPASLDIPRLDRPFPEVELSTLAGERVQTRGRERPLLIALWASWCSPCIDKMPDVRELAKNADCDLLYYSVDEPGRVARAQEIAAQRGFGAGGLAAPGLGAADPLWVMINSMHGGSLGVPKFALLDRDGVLRYAGSDLDNLALALQSPNRTTADALLEDPANLDVTVELRRGAGTLRFLGADFALRLVDADGDGDVDADDQRAGPILQIDRNGDGRFAGPTEHLWVDQPFDLLGGQLEIGAIAEDQSSLRLLRSQIAVPRIGRKIAGYLFHRRDGTNVFLGKIQRPTVLAFWSAANAASLTGVDQFLEGVAAEDVDVHLLCVDEAEAFEGAMETAAKRRWPAELLGPATSGGAEIVYQACAGMPTTGRTTPVFVVLDTGGTVRAATTDAAAALAAVRPR